MDKQSQLKVIKAGFLIIRRDDHPVIRIKFIGHGHHEWSTLEKFNTKAERDRKANQLLELSTTIED